MSLATLYATIMFFEKPPLASRQASLKVVKYEYISIICTIRGVELYLLG